MQGNGLPWPGIAVCGVFLKVKQAHSLSNVMCSSQSESKETETWRRIQNTEDKTAAPESLVGVTDFTFCIVFLTIRTRPPIFFRVGHVCLL